MPGKQCNKKRVGINSIPAPIRRLPAESIKWLVRVMVILGLLAGCTTFHQELPEPEKKPFEKISGEITRESENLEAARMRLTRKLEKRSSMKIAGKPILPTYDPLEDHMVSFSMVDEELQIMLYSLSKSAGINLIIDPAVNDEKRLITLNFENVPAAMVLREVLGMFDLFYEISGNVIRIKPFQEKFFKLNFLDTEVSSSFQVGGDVLGASGSESSSGLKGKFELTGRGSGVGNSYDVVENSVSQMLSKAGKFSLNRLSGSLYVKDNPAVIHSISRLIGHLKFMLSRQVLIEARIIEVSLSDEHKYGIDWGVVRDKAASLTSKVGIAWALGNGFVVDHENSTAVINATLNMLDTFGDTKVVSNPSIRSKHGKPAIISVGTSYTYKKKVETSVETTSTGERETADVEISTVFDGLILGVIPFIGEDETISLLINPIKSDVDKSSLQLEAVTGGNQQIALPRVSVKEISTTISMQAGDVVILGGLIDKQSSSDNKEVPFLSSLPGLGYLFKNEQEIEDVRELVIILSVTLI
jgi:MSHA type pilus biogenesis protein MshL